MNKKLMLLATGVLAALAFAALPAVASAGEYKADCENGGPTCTGTVTGGAAQLRNDKGEGISCSHVDGKATVFHESSTGELELTFTGCVETITGFKFKCNSTGAGSGEVNTGPMVTHLIYLEDNTTTKGIKVTLGSGVTFTCAGFSKKTVTGHVIGEITKPECGTYQASHTAEFEEKSTGVQKWQQVTTTGEFTDLLSNNDAGGSYTTSAQTGTGTITWNGTRVKLTC